MPDIIFPNIGVSIYSVNRIVFTIFGFSIFWYAVFVTLGILTGIFFGAYLAPKLTKQDHNKYMDFVYWVIPACIIGARLFYVIFSWENYRNNFFGIFALREGGLAIYGVIIAAVITSIIYTKAKKINWFLFADTLVVGLIIGHVIGRFGNFVNREAFGGYTDGLFAMQIQLEQVWQTAAVTEQMLQNTITQYGTTYIQVHPTMLYEAFFNFLLFIFLNLYRKHKRFNGELVAYYFLGYGILRFFLEGLRTDQLLIGAVPVSQLLSAVLALIGLVFLIKNYIKPKSV